MGEAITGDGGGTAEKKEMDRRSCNFWSCNFSPQGKKGKGSPYSITERRVPELIPVLGSQPACDVSHKSVGRLSLFSARPADTHATLNRAGTSFAAW